MFAKIVLLQVLSKSCVILIFKIMTRKEFERFRQEIRSWMDSHPDEYDAFVEEMNGKSFMGIQRVYMLAMRLAPQLMAKARRELHGDLNRTEPDGSIFTADDTLAQQLVSEFRNTEKFSIVPAVLSWLYYGRCYETMVERLEGLIEESGNRVHKWLCGFMIKLLMLDVLTTIITIFLHQ